MSDKPIINVKVVNYQRIQWTVDENGITSQAKVPYRHEFQFQREGSDEWTPFSIEWVTENDLTDE